MKSIQDLAREAGMTQYVAAENKCLEKFAALIREAVVQEFLAGVGEPFDDWPEFNHHAMGCGLEDRDITDRYEAMHYGWQECEERMLEQGPFYTADQMAAAVLRERERCAQIAEKTYSNGDGIEAWFDHIAAAIRGQR